MINPTKINTSPNDAWINKKGLSQNFQWILNININNSSNKNMIKTLKRKKL